MQEKMEETNRRQVSGERRRNIAKSLGIDRCTLKKKELKP